MKSGVLYRITADIAATNNTGWDAASKTQVTVGGEIGELKDEAADLKSATDAMTIEELLLRSDLPGTTVAVTFDGNGNPSTITHTSGGNTVRIDVFTWGDNTVTEVRTASSKRITITTNLTTLAQTVSEIEEVE